MVAIPDSTLHVPASSAALAGPGLIDELLRDRSRFLERLDRPAQHAVLVRTLAVTILAGAGVYGAAIGLFRGGLQVPFAALKFPLVLLLTAGLVTPALSALRRVVHGVAEPARDALLTLSALALTSLLLAAQAPLLLLAVVFDAGYHGLTLTAAAGFGVAGAAGVALLFRGLATAASTRAPRMVGVATVLVFLVVFSQMAWTLRPWLVRPRAPEVVFVRALEGSWVDSLIRSSRSARGVYDRDAAPLPGAERSGLRR